MTEQTFQVTSDEGDEYAVRVDTVGVAVSVQRVWGGREGTACALEDFDRDLCGWVTSHVPPDVAEAIRAAVDAAGAAAALQDDMIP